MIDSIDKISGLGVWNNYSKSPNLHNFGHYNIIYGWNGVGKTSLSRLFMVLGGNKIDDFPDLEFTATTNNKSRITKNNSTLNVDVFNEDFIKRNVRFDEHKSNSIRLTLGENIELLNEIEKLQDSYNINEEELKNNNSDIYELRNNINNTFTALARDVTNIANLGRNYNRPSAISDFNRLEKKPDIADESFRNAISIINTSSPKDRIQTISWQHIVNNLKYIETKSNSILQASVVRVAIARLDENSDISLWVEHGLELHKKHSIRTCEFCGNAITTKRINELEHYFNEAYKVLDQSISDLIKEVDSTIGEINSINVPTKTELYDNLQNDYTKTAKRYSAAKDNVIDDLKKVKTQLLNKRNSPTEVITEPTSIDTTNLKVAIQNIDSIINRHNNQTIHFNNTQKEAIDTIKNHCIQNIYDNIVEKRKKLTKLNNTNTSLKDKQKNLACKIEEAKGRVSSTAAACSALNENIERFLGRNDIRFTTIPDNDTSFYIMREDQFATDLSEGERTAVALSYFTLLLESHKNWSDLIVVIDDPISSLDSSLRYRAFSFIKNYTINARQLFILTHDFDFLHLVINWFSHLKNARYYMIENSYSDDGVRSAYLIEMDKALIKYETEYAYLFSLVLNYVDSNDYTICKAYQMANIGRKLLDSFLLFQAPLFTTPFKRLESINFDNVKKSAIYKFVNDESHITSSGGIEPQLPREAHQCMKDLLDMIHAVAPTHYDTLVGEIQKTS